MEILDSEPDSREMRMNMISWGIESMNKIFVSSPRPIKRLGQPPKFREIKYGTIQQIRLINTLTFSHRVGQSSSAHEQRVRE